jgi:hypothetical protein
MGSHDNAASTFFCYYGVVNDVFDSLWRRRSIEMTQGNARLYRRTTAEITDSRKKLRNSMPVVTYIIKSKSLYIQS